jgi:hypothetical protein
MLIRNRALVGLATFAVHLVPHRFLLWLTAKGVTPPSVVTDDGHTADLW